MMKITFSSTNNIQILHIIENLVNNAREFRVGFLLGHY